MPGGDFDNGRRRFCVGRRLPGAHPRQGGVGVR